MKKVVLSLLLLLFFMVLPSDSKVPTEQERLASGEVIITTTAQGFVGKFIIEGDAQKAWDKLAEIDGWRKVFDFVLSSHEMEKTDKQDFNSRGMYRKYRNLYIKGMYRGRMMRMLFDAEISGSEAVTPKTSGKKAPLSKGKGVSLPKKAPGAPGGYSVPRPGYPAVSYFRGGAIKLDGPTNNVSGSPFIDLSNFIQVNLSMMTTQLMTNGHYQKAAQITIQVNLDYQKLFLADHDVSLFRLDYRSSEFDKQIRIGINKIAQDFKDALSENN